MFDDIQVFIRETISSHDRFINVYSKKYSLKNLETLYVCSTNNPQTFLWNPLTSKTTPH